MKLYKYSLLIAAISLMLFSSCTSRKKILYLQNSHNDSTLVYQNQNEEHIINSGDVLHISFYSLNKTLTEVFNRQESTNNSYAMWNSEAGVYINGFSVNDSGFVELPLIGSIYLRDLKISKAKLLIQKQAKKYIKDVTVIVKLINYRFTVIGEVTRPGTYTNFNNSLNIFQAISKAGDVTIYGNKKQLKIIRETQDGKVIIPFDITDISILTSNAYYIKPNDIIYIEPMKSKSFRSNLPNFSLLFSSITTAILVLNFMIK